MKYRLLLFLCLTCHSLFAQFNSDNLYGSWVKTSLSFKDGGELPDDNILKGTYVKYTFTGPDKMNISQEYYDDGTQFTFEVLNNDILVRTSAGSIINQLRILELNNDHMVLQQPGRYGFDDPAALKYTFTRQSTVQDAMPLNASDIFEVINKDTIYRECPKVYAGYKGESFHLYLFFNVGDENYMTGRSGYVKASFIVSKTGVADSLKMLEGIDADYDKRFAKAFNKVRKDWRPAILNGKYVPVQMFVDISYATFGSAMSAQEYGDKANTAFKLKDYQAALYLYDEALKNHPSDEETLFNRGICKQRLGNQTGACEDWKKIKDMGGTIADDLLAKYCH